VSRRRLLAVALLLAACSNGAPPSRVTVLGPIAPAWTMFRGDPARDGRPPGVTLTPAAAARLQPAWSVDLGSPITGSPVVAGGMVVAGTEDGTLEALSTEQGNEVWKQTGLGPLTGQPLIAGGSLYVGSSDGRLYAFDLMTGTRVWDWRAPGEQPALWGGPVVFNGLLLVGIGSQTGGYPAETGRLVALDPASGDRIWATCLIASCAAGDGVRSSVALDPAGYGFVGVGSPDDGVAGFDVGIGKVTWKTSLYPDGGRGLDVWATPLVFLSHGQERVAAAGQAGTFAVLDAANGAVAWTRELVSGSAAHGLVGSPGFDGRALYVPSAGSPSGIFALGPDDGSTLWQAPSARPVYSSPAVGLGVLVYGEGALYGDLPEGAVVAISSVDGHQLWRVETGAAVVASPAVVGEAVYAADRRGHLMAFRPGS
jgi:eukaryotic-like serine/threonine-protein kinase